jgi:cytochrome c2
MKTILATAATLCLLFTPLARALELHASRTAATDLAVTGQLAGLAPGEVRYVTYADLRALPTTTLTLTEGFLKGPRPVTALFVSDFVKALPTTALADCVLATCNDGYASVYTNAFIAQYRPFFVLEIDGQGPASWPIKGVTVYNPGPYVITVSPELAPAAATYLDLGHKKPSGVVTVEIGHFAERYAGDYTGAWEHLSAKAIAGREIWINSCGSCHPGPGSGGFSGTKSGRPFPVLVAYAAYAQPYFKKYVRDPKSLSPSAKMEPHPHYTDEQLDQLIAFITAGTPH